MKRRQFVGGLAAAAGLAACSSEPRDCSSDAATGETFEWSMATSWPPGLPGLGTGAQDLADRVEVRWNGAGGTVDVHRRLQADRFYRLPEGGEPAEIRIAGSGSRR